MPKKILCLLLSIIFIANAFSGCTTTKIVEPKQTTTETTTIATDDVNFQISYTKADSLNPFKSETLNNQTLSTLVYDSLFKIDDSFKSQTQIAKDFEYENATKLKVSIKNNLKFSNGSNLTAGDVVYSFNEAKKSKSFSKVLNGISSASKIDDYTISFTLSYANPYAQNLLTFPVVLYGDAEKSGFVIGSGRYYFKEKNNNETVLIVNKHYKNFTPHFTTVHLVNVVSSESIDNALTISDIDFAYRDLSSSTKNLNCQKKLFPINNLVYLGLNSSKSNIVSNVNIRQAISMAIDRTTLSKSAYQGFAKVATSIFNPASELSNNTSIFGEKTDITGAKQAIAKSGYDSEKLKLSILVNKENQNRVTMAKLIKTSLQSAGFEVSIKKVSSKQYKKDIKKKNFDIYIGEIKLTDDMNLYPFFASNGGAKYGINLKSSCVKSYKKYLDGSSNLGKFVLDFNTDMPFVPVLYRQGMIAYSKSMHGDMQGGYSNYFSNIEDWYFNS